jgi:hypothetical protein
MEPTPPDRVTRRPLLVSILAAICVLAVIKELIELIGKPVDPHVPNPDVQVWFGYRFEGGITAKILTLPHLVVYGYAAYGLFRMRRLGWWVAFLYLLYMPVSFVLYMRRYFAGAAWEIAFTVRGQGLSITQTSGSTTGIAWAVAFTAASIVLIVLLEVYLYKHRHLFTH